jgi:hypothetical protein
MPDVSREGKHLYDKEDTGLASGVLMIEGPNFREWPWLHHLAILGKRYVPQFHSLVS